MDQKVKLGGSFGYGDSYLEFLFRHFKVFRFHTILHDAAGAVPAHNAKGPGYRYVILGVAKTRGPNSCLLGRVTGLVFCLHLKLLLPSTF